MRGKRNNKLRDWSVKKKLIYSFGLIIITTFILISMLIIGMKTIEGRLVKLYNGPTMNVHYSADLYYPHLDIQRAVNRILAEGVENKDQLYPELEETLEKNLAIVEEATIQLTERLLTEEDKARLEAINSKLNEEVSGYREEVFRLIQSGDYDAAKEYNDAYYKQAVDEMKIMIEDLEASILDTAESYEKSAATLAIVMIVIGILLLVVITYIAIKLSLKVTASIVEPIVQIEAAAKQLRVGDLSQGNAITYESADELGSLAKTMRESLFILNDYVKEICENFERVANGDLTKDFSEITDFLGDFASLKTSFVVILKEFNTTLNQIKDASEQVDTGSDEVAAAANDLASGTCEQASAVEELTATIETVTSMAEKAAKEAEKSADKMLTSVQEAQKEKEQMKELQEEMNRIQEISREIEAIVISIEQIASQTSLLALNASIEAARAGDAGKGFAVVADQIGKLAMDSAHAVVSTKELINKTVEEIEKGSKVTERTAVGYERIIKELEAFAESSKANSEVSKAQSSALEQIEQGIDQISLVMQQNAASSEECSAISEELAARAEEVDALVNKFQLYEG